MQQVSRYSGVVVFLCAITLGASFFSAEKRSGADLPDNSVQFHEALHRHHVPAEMVILPKGNHGFFGVSRDEWIQPMFTWLVKTGWMKP